ncbi:MAG: leucine-rich repeat domain-containing protein [Promethearchaeota archaeon]
MQKNYDVIPKQAEFLEDLEKMLGQTIPIIDREYGWIGAKAENKMIIKLWIEYYRIDTIPKSIGNLASLQELDLSHNQIRSLPESIGNLASLQELDLSHNQIRSLPESIGNLTSLQKIYLNHNKLTALPESFYNLKNLKQISLYENKWSGEWKDIENLTDISRIFNICQKLNGIFIFISHAWDDQEQYQVVKLNDYLEKNIIVKKNNFDINIIHKVYICEKDVIDDIWDFMINKIPKSHLLLFIATNNSIKSESCRYELFLADKNNVEILPIKNIDITWKALKKIELIDQNKHFQGYLDLSNPKEKFEFDGKNFDEIYEKLNNYIKINESDLKKSKLINVQLENIKKDIVDVFHTKEFRDILKENIKDFKSINHNMSNNKITNFRYLLKIGQLMNRREKKYE